MGGYLAEGVLVTVLAIAVNEPLLEFSCLSPTPTPMPTAEPTTTAAIIAVTMTSARGDRRRDGGVARLASVRETLFLLVSTASGGLLS